MSTKKYVGQNVGKSHLTEDGYRIIVEYLKAPGMMKVNDKGRMYSAYSAAQIADKLNAAYAGTPAFPRLITTQQINRIRVKLFDRGSERYQTKPPMPTPPALPKPQQATMELAPPPPKDITVGSLIMRLDNLDSDVHSLLQAVQVHRAACVEEKNEIMAEIQNLKTVVQKLLDVWK